MPSRILAAQQRLRIHLTGLTAAVLREGRHSLLESDTITIPGAVANWKPGMTCAIAF